MKKFEPLQTATLAVSESVSGSSGWPAVTTYPTTSHKAHTVVQRSSTKEDMKSSGKGSSSSSGGSTRRLYRFVGQNETYQSRAASLSLDAQRQLRAALESDMEALGQAMANHMGGNTNGSPFVSLTSDFNLLAQTTDTSRGGAGSIVHNAPYIAIFDIPNSMLISAGGDSLQSGEGEWLVWLPPGVSLADYRVGLAPNIYKGKYWNASNLE